MLSVEEALGDFRSAIKEKGYAMRLIEYSHNISTNDSHETRKVLQGGFLLVKYHSRRSTGATGYLAARADCERICDEFTAKMVADSRNGHPLFYYSLDMPDSIHVDPEVASGDGFYSGCLVTFTLANYFKDCTDGVAWADSGLTPYT